MIKPLFIATLEGALNRYLALDDHIEQYLTPMVGKVIALHVTSLNSSIYLCPSEQGMQILESYPGAADATLSGSLSALGLMGLSATPMRSLFKGEVRIEGDTQLARRLQRLFEKLDINLESKIARYTGDAFAQRLAKLFRGSRDWTQHTLTTFRLNLEEFLQEETRELPAKSEAELFFREIDTCRSDCDRLSARLDRLEASTHSISEPQ
ncbi:ubiquinone biosynthesis accessory factor UbiJ [Methylomonas sp. 2BW1-5-20]|uniref:ubiquinone biosynthesis accessory factor UbiJ n=1 Tax=Methylomonas sp. 2BW1-5-20 TaxID=3376686 RepID=UPI00404E2804